AGREFVHQELGARIAMRLKNSPKAPTAPQVRRLKRGADLGRVMAVVVQDGNSIHFPFELETAVRAAKVREAGSHAVGSKIQLQPHGDGRQRVLNVVASHDRSGE